MGGSVCETHATHRRCGAQHNITVNQRIVFEVGWSGFVAVAASIDNAMPANSPGSHEDEEHVKRLDIGKLRSYRCCGDQAAAFGWHFGVGQCGARAGSGPVVRCCVEQTAGCGGGQERWTRGRMSDFVRPKRRRACHVIWRRTEISTNGWEVLDFFLAS